jgi:hypothetical protein
MPLPEKLFALRERNREHLNDGFLEYVLLFYDFGEFRKTITNEDARQALKIDTAVYEAMVFLLKSFDQFQTEIKDEVSFDIIRRGTSKGKYIVDDFFEGLEVAAVSAYRYMVMTQKETSEEKAKDIVEKFTLLYSSYLIGAEARELSDKFRQDIIPRRLLVPVASKYLCSSKEILAYVFTD